MDDPFSESDWISPEEFLRCTQEAAVQFLSTILGLLEARLPYTKHQYSVLLNVATAYETYLDNHGARENADWEFHAELVASIRNLGIAAFHLCHILNRFERLYMEKMEPEDKRFVKDLKDTLDYVNASWLRLAKEVCSESERLGFVLPPAAGVTPVLSDSFLEGKLPRTGEWVEVLDGEAKMLGMVRKVRKASSLARDFRVSPGLGPAELLEVVPTKLDVKKVQKLSNLLQGIESDYDTYVRRTPLEAEHSCLPLLRGTCATSLHIMVALRWLIHFYERHLDPIRRSLIKKRMSELVDKGELLDYVINHLYQAAYTYLGKANRCAETILNRYADVERVELNLPKPVGFHARPATYVSLIVNEFGTDVFLLVDNERYSAKSVMALLEAGWILADKGASTAFFEGDKRVLKDLKVLADHNYCEDQDIPRELSYLRILRNR